MRKFLAIVVLAWYVVCGLALYKIVHGQELPRQAGPLGVPPTQPEIELGRMLFFDPILSVNNSVSCSTCHDPHLGYTDGRPVAVGINGLAGTRNTPTLLNVGYVKPMAFWDGRAVETTDQSVLPLTNPREMGSQSLGQVMRRLQASSRYQVAFNTVFPMRAGQPSAITEANYARAMACFQASLNTADAPIDRYLAGEVEALTPDARVGYELVRKARCFECHPPPLYTDNKVHNVGAEFATRGRITDNGRFVVTKSDADVGKFKTPTLRGLVFTAPYMHNGQMETIERVVRHFNAGGHVKLPGAKAEQRESRIDARVQRIGWTPQQEEYVALFLREAFTPADYPLVEAP